MKILKSLLIIVLVFLISSYVKTGLKKDVLLVLYVISILIGLFFVFSKKRSFLLLCLFSFVFLNVYAAKKEGFLFKKRNFFGTIIVKKIEKSAKSSAILALFHGNTLHGKQIVSIPDNEYSYNPDSYYGPQAAIKDFFDVFKRPQKPSVAWLGLGSGATICYIQPDAKNEIIEIDQDIIDVSKKYRYFRYLEHCAPDAEIKTGDARIEISKETEQKYDLIVIDVFSSHFIPVHLTTKEAIETYRSKLKSDGLILFHISSKAFDVEPILARIAKELNMSFIVRLLPQDRNCSTCIFPQWGVLGNTYEDAEIKALLAMPGWRKGEFKKDTPLWTDDFHNLLSALRH